MRGQGVIFGGSGFVALASFSGQNAITVSGVAAGVATSNWGLSSFSITKAAGSGFPAVQALHQITPTTSLQIGGVLHGEVFPNLYRRWFSSYCIMAAGRCSFDPVY